MKDKQKKWGLLPAEYLAADLAGVRLDAGV